MNNKAFTLMELLATIIIISLITALAVPAVINQIANNKSKIDDATKKIIYNAAELYMTNNISEYPKLSGNKYCISLDRLVDAGILETPINDYKTGDTISLTKKVSVSVNSNNEYDSFEIVDEC